jgi:aryl-alcohol dehydrogenase
MRITAAVMEKADGLLTRRTIKLEEVELDDPQDEEVLVKVTSCGVCGTDRGCIHGLEPYPTPGVLGHEAAGVVEAIGGKVTLVKPGDRVMIGFPFCGECRTCRSGEMRYCEKGQLLMFSGKRLDGSGGMRRADGEDLAGRFFQQSSWATYAVALERQLVKIPDGIDPDLTGPYGCSISTGAGAVLNELRPPPGSSIAIFGAGNVGLAAVMKARLTGATCIIAIDTVRHRLELATELGATDMLEHNGDTVAKLKELTAVTWTTASSQPPAPTWSQKPSRHSVFEAPVRWWAARNRPPRSHSITPTCCSRESESSVSWAVAAKRRCSCRA